MSIKLESGVTGVVERAELLAGMVL